MSLTVTVLNSKGGVGKTTSAVFLAAAMVQTGRSVELWDADVQASATEWSIEAADDGTPLPFPVLPVNASSIKRQQTDADVLIIDTPPGEASIQTAAVRRSDVVVIPTAASPLDLKRVWATLDALGSIAAIVLFTGVNPRTITYRAAVEALDTEEVAVFSRPVKKLESYVHAVGTNPTDLGQFQDLAAELLDLMEAHHD